jgi:TP901 family phage tail tape measure protein
MAGSLLEIANTLAQAGDVFGGDQDIAKVAETIGKTNLASTFGDIKSTTEGLIAVLGQFNKTGDETIHVLDIANDLSKKYAFESSNLFDAVRTGGAAFANANGSIEEFGALLTTIRQTTRIAPNQIATALNSSIQQLSKPQSIQLLEEVTGGKIRNADGNLKGIVDRLRELAAATKNYDQEQLTGILSKIVDVRGEGKFLIPFIKDLQRASEGTSLFENSLKGLKGAPGSFDRDVAIGLNRIDVQLQAVQSRFQEVFRDLAQNRGLQEFVKQLLSIAKATGSVLDALGPFIPALVKLGTIKLAQGLATNVYPFFVGLNKFVKGGIRGVSRLGGEEDTGGLPGTGLGIGPTGGGGINCSRN